MFWEANSAKYKSKAFSLLSFKGATTWEAREVATGRNKYFLPNREIFVKRGFLTSVLAVLWCLGRGMLLAYGEVLEASAERLVRIPLIESRSSE